MSRSTKTLLGGITVLGITGILCKLLGVVFTIPLSREIGTEGMGFFQKVYPTYNLLLTLSSAGLPVAVSRMVSSSLAKGDPRNAHRVFRTALCLLTALGAALTVLLLAGNGVVSRWVGEPEASPGFYAIAPCLAIVCALSAYRGFMQGQQNMVPTAASQLIEQCAKICAALPLAIAGKRISSAYGAAGALLGITISEALALLYMMIRHRVTAPAYKAIPQQSDAPEADRKSILRELIRIAIPITIGACIVPLAQFFDSVMLTDRMIASGIPAEEARSLYGIFSGMVIRLINVPTALALAVAMSLVPAVSAAWAVGDKQKTAEQSDMGIRFAFLIGFPCAIGMSALAGPIFRLVYGASCETEEQVRIAGELLTMSSLTVVLFTVVQASTSVLQGINKQKIPMYTLVAGVGCKILLNYVLVAIPGVNIHGGPIASIVCYSVSMIPNLICVCRYTGLKFNWMDWLVRPGLASAAMAAVVILLRNVLPVSWLCLALEILAGVITFAGAGLLTGAIRREDLNAILARKRR